MPRVIELPKTAALNDNMVALEFYGGIQVVTIRTENCEPQNIYFTPAAMDRLMAFRQECRQEKS